MEEAEDNLVASADMREFHRQGICVKYTQHGTRYVEAWKQLNLAGGKTASITPQWTSKTFSINIQLPRLAIMCGNNLVERYELMRNFTVLLGKMIFPLKIHKA